MTNRLADASSPYLLQHADNPVDWYEWGPDALERARAEDRPILLSIGYAACHWCHVMAHESFEDPDTAALMNRLFVNIKLDREQRPDLDRIYQLAHQVLQRRGGGWPLTAFLDPHTHLPFFVGTYFPKAPRHGLPAFADVLARVAAWYREQPAARKQSNQALAEFFAAQERGESAPTAGGVDPHAAALAALAPDFDARYGGFGGAPKFPYATQLEWLLGRPDESAQRMARRTLTRMCRGGIFDHVGGGFFRYSVDARWEIPHFEKMLYDNGLLLAALAAAGPDDPVIARATHMTAGWVLREMQHPGGGFYASIDADSEGHEGTFYLWTPDAVRAALTEYEDAAFTPAFGLDRPPNFEGRWHLHCGSDADLAKPEIASAARKLATLRGRRLRPGTDDKVLAGWNGLMIRGLARAARVFGEPGWADAARDAARFVRAELWRDGRLVTSWRDGRVVRVAFLDDYAYLLDGLLELMQVGYDKALHEFADALADDLLERFEDRARGGFWFTSHDHEKLVQRPKSFVDVATPNGNGVAALALARLGRLSAEPRYTTAASRALDAARGALGQWPHAHAAVLLALADEPAAYYCTGPECPLS